MVNLFLLQILQTFLHLQLHNVEERVSQLGGKSASAKNSREEKQRRKDELKKMSRKQRRVSCHWTR